MVRIATAGNSDTAAFSTLLEKGYILNVELNTDSTSGLYITKKEGHEFIGEDPIAVLGLVTIFEHRGTEWEPSNKEVEEFTKFEKKSFSFK